MKRTLLSTLLLVTILAGCSSPDAARQRADRAAQRIIETRQAELFGVTNSFTLERPSETLRRRLMIDQELLSATNSILNGKTGDAVELSFVESLQIGARNNNEYQDLKEDIFRAALALDLEQYAFDNSFSGILSGSAESDTTGLTDVNKAKAGFTAGITRKLKSGATLAGNITLDVVKLLSGDNESSFGVLLDTTITIPMLRGAGREIVTEPLTQAERNVLYAILQFERYKKTYAVQVARDYLAVLQNTEKVLIAQDNLKNLESGLARAEKLAEAGRLPETQLDQTHQDVLRARNRVITARERAEETRDAFKSTLGLPIDARIALGDRILKRLTDDMETTMTEAEALHPDRFERRALQRAMEQRNDLKIAVFTVEDATRKIRVAANALKAGIDISISGSTSERQFSSAAQSDIHFGDGNYSAGLEIDLPWNRREEGNAYRQTLVNLNKATRALEEKEDQVKREVRNVIRNLNEARETYRIQKVAVQLAEKRVRNTEMFLESGRSETRDLLEAQEALVGARSALTDALTSYYSAYWNMLRDTGELQVDSTGMWNLDYQD